VAAKACPARPFFVLRTYPLRLLEFAISTSNRDWGQSHIKQEHTLRTFIAGQPLRWLAAFAILACADSAIARAEDAKARLEFRLAKAEKTDGFDETKVGDMTIWMSKQAALANADIMSARAEENEIDGVKHHVVLVNLTEAGGKKMLELTDKNRGSLIAIVVDGKVISAPRINDRIKDRAQITAKFTKAEAENLAKRLNGK
jgi:preprotein translocase subunit SecD